MLLYCIAKENKYVWSPDFYDRTIAVRSVRGFCMKMKNSDVIRFFDFVTITMFSAYLFYRSSRHVTPSPNLFFFAVAPARHFHTITIANAVGTANVTAYNNGFEVVTTGAFHLK